MTETNTSENKEITHQEDYVTKIDISDKNMQYNATIYQIIPGIEFIYGQIHSRSINIAERRTTSSNIIEICHCQQGRMENYINGMYKYISKGDIAIVRTNSIGTTSYFPMNHFHGIFILIDVDKIPVSRAEMLKGVSVNPREVVSKFCSSNDSFVTAAPPALEKYFQDLYNPPVSDYKSYFTVKLMELLLLLDNIQPEKQYVPQPAYSEPQVKMAKEISGYMLSNKNDKITLEQLSLHFGKSEAYIKNAFKAVYGVSVGSYIRTLKMESAAYMLEYTDKSILEIANEHGYDNGSKFASAFRSIKGVNPAEYRANIYGKNK